MGPEDDPFAGLDPGLKPMAPDADDAIHWLADADRLSRDLGLRPTHPASGIGFANLDDADDVGFLDG